MTDVKREKKEGRWREDEVGRKERRRAG